MMRVEYRATTTRSAPYPSLSPSPSPSPSLSLSLSTPLTRPAAVAYNRTSAYIA